MRKPRVRQGIQKDQLFDVESPLAIELRRILIRLSRFIDLDRKTCLMVTSSEQGEGKSLFTVHFSMVLAYHLKSSILLIDGDVRRPVQHQVFQVTRSPGLAEFLSATEGAEGIEPRQTQIANLHFLPAGAAGQQPSQLFSGGRFRSAIQALHQRYDCIIVDAPPVVPVSDPLHYIEAADGVIFIVMAGRTHQDVVKRGVDILKGSGANILGVVANNLSEVLPYYYDRKYYGYDRDRAHG
ncbi:MAG: CpsD/CapB family tyrosine-protein kinase, partial [bacterium]